MFIKIESEFEETFLTMKMKDFYHAGQSWCYVTHHSIFGGPEIFLTKLELPYITLGQTA